MARGKKLSMFDEQHVEKIAKIYFLGEVKGMIQKDIGAVLGMTNVNVSRYWNKYILKLLKKTGSKEYELFYSMVEEICEKENYSHDLKPPTTYSDSISNSSKMITIEVVEEMKSDTDLSTLIIRRKKLINDVNEITELITKKIDFILDDLLKEAERYASAIEEMIDNLTVKQYREKHFPECFTRKVEVLLFRIKKLEETSEAIERSFLTTESAIQKYNDANEYIFQTRLKLEDLDMNEKEVKEPDNTHQ